MNRREFLFRSSSVTAAGLLARSIVSAQTPAPASAPAAPRPPGAPAPANPVFTPLRRDVGYFTARGGTIGWLASKDALVAVDTQFPDTAQLFLDGLPGRGDRKLDLVVNTHHHGDHTGGNGVLKPAAKSMVAHANAVRLQRERAQPGTADRQVVADTTFADAWRSELGGEVVSAKYHGTGHTSGDIVTLFEKANVIHMGDLMFHRMYPVIDRPGGASIRHWIVVLETVAKTYPQDAVYIFGHGNTKSGVTGKPADLLAFRDYLTALLDYTQKKINAGEPKEKAVVLDGGMPGFSDFEQLTRLGGNIGVAYDELTEKKI
ncbi:MAG: MBL fold metallo-hydrolase [Opitutaceae bacterium]